MEVVILVLEDPGDEALEHPIDLGAIERSVTDTDSSMSRAIAFTLPISSRVTTQKRISWSSPVFPPRPL